MYEPAPSGDSRSKPVIGQLVFESHVSKNGMPCSAARLVALQRFRFACIVPDEKFFAHNNEGTFATAPHRFVV